LSEDDYLTMARLKTAHYSCAIPLAMGALCGEGTDEQVEGLRSFGLSCGLAFQIQDDLLNLVGDAEAQGKDYRSDVTEGKRTLVMVRALSQLNREDSHELETILSSRTTDAKQLDRAVALAQKSGAIDYAREYAQSLIHTAKDELSSVSCTSTACETLFSMADFFVSRAS
jgi:geranylgeranyl diphosphate synthase type I